MIKILIQGLQLPLPIGNAFLKAADIGIVIVDNINNPKGALANGLAIGIVAATDIKIQKLHSCFSNSNSLIIP